MWLRCCWGVVLLQLVYHTIAMPQPQNMLLPLSPWHNNLTVTSRFWRHLWPTHANCRASIDRAWPALSANAWRLARVGWNGRQKTFAQAAMQGRWAPPLSLVKKIKNYFIINICYFRTRFYIIIKIHYVQLACYFGGRHCCIGVMALSVIPSNVQLSRMRYIAPSHLPHADVAHWHPSATSPCLSLFSTLSPPAPAYFWLVVVWLCSIGGRWKPQCIYYNILFCRSICHPKWLGRAPYRTPPPHSPHL